APDDVGKPPGRTGISLVDGSGLDDPRRQFQGSAPILRRGAARKLPTNRRDRGQRSMWSLTCCTASAVSRPMTDARTPGSSAEIASSICWVVRSTVAFFARNTLAATASNPAAAVSRTTRRMFLGTLIFVPFQVLSIRATDQ